MAYFGFFKSPFAKQARSLSEFCVETRSKAQSLYLEAIALEDKGELEQAIQKYDDAIALVPIFWEALDNRSLCQIRLGQFAAAITGLELSTQIAPDSRLALWALISCYREVNQNVNAMHVADYFMKRWPGESPFAQFRAPTIEKRT